ncbi:hypothetical protein LUZ62_045375 [Rhynchospora pubera]|uniref:Uncharacterized protein n=1 Tax=Rhynchospora pubera TaxID=906938 RepID=A0AAV8FM88_9POAL|nr:hypothetical protein LUZ62_045375 [Rhynchospora pubera]
MAQSIVAPIKIKALSQSPTSFKARSNPHFQISHHSPFALQLQRGRSPSVLVSVATDASTKEPAASASSSPNNPDAKISGPTPPTIVNSSGFSLQFPDIPSTWSTWLIGAAVFLSVPLYRRIKNVEEVIEKAEETAESAIGAIDKAAEEVGKLASDLAKTSGDGKIKEVALKIEGIAERVERDAEKAEEVLHKVEHITEEIEELLEPLIEKSEAEEKEKTNEEKTHKHNNKSESHDNDL